MTTTIGNMMMLLIVFTLGCAHPTGPEGCKGCEGGGWSTGLSGGMGGQAMITTASHDGGAAGMAGAGGNGTTSSTSTGSSLQDLKDLCTDTGGTLYQDQCCSDNGEMPDSCMSKPSCGGVLTCLGGNIDPDMWLCSCPDAACFDRKVGCTIL